MASGFEDVTKIRMMRIKPKGVRGQDVGIDLRTVKRFQE